MNTPLLKENESDSLSVFQLASRIEIVSSSENSPARIATPFADLMLQPEKLAAALKTEDKETVAGNEKRAGKTRKSRRSARHAGANLKATAFQLAAPAAQSVKLAGDFSDWESSAFEMVQNSDGLWSTIVPLSPGEYAYRFIVDGKWCEDPQCPQQTPNPFGTLNSVKRVDG